MTFMDFLLMVLVFAPIAAVPAWLGYAVAKLIGILREEKRNATSTN